MSEEKILVIASAGGHLTQALCATSRLENLLLVSNRKLISSEKVKKVYKIWDTQKNPFIHFLNIFVALFIILRERPKAIFSTGGPICLPYALVAKFLRVRFVYLDTLSRVVELSNTGKLIYKYKLYDRFLCQWPGVAHLYDGLEYYGQTFDIGNHGDERLPISSIG